MSVIAAQLATTASASRTSRLYWAVVDTLVMARRHLLHIPQVPEQLISATFQPVIFVLLFRYVFGGAIDVPGTSYVNFLMAGIFVQSIVFEGMNSGIGLAHDLKRGIMDRFRTLPMAPSATIAGPIVADMLRNLFIVGVMLAVGFAVGFRPEADALAWLAVVGLLLAVSVAISWISAIIALLVRDPEAVQTAAFMFVMPLTFASSAFVPVESMPGWLQTFTAHQPISLAVNAVRNLLLGQPAGDGVWQTLLWCGAIVAVCVPASVGLYRRMAAG
jgi:ABC-2 type transport system permease protein/oleandomycin transport system permease protein